MPKFQPKTTSQLKAIFGLAKKNRVDEDTLHEYAFQFTQGRTDRLSLLSFDEANALIKRLGGDPFASSRTPRRTENYRRQQAGVQQIAQPGHLEKMWKLAVERSMSANGLERMGLRMIKHWPPRTTDETNKIIEALKAMNKRDIAKEAA
jgi:hypothetical protein